MGTDALNLHPEFLDEKKLKATIVAKTLRSFAFLILVFFVIQPVLFMFISEIFYGKIYYYFNLTQKTLTPNFTLWMSPILEACVILLTLTFIAYLICVQIINENKLTDLKAKTISSLKNKPELCLFGLTFIWITIAFLCYGDFIHTFGSALLAQGYVYYLCYVGLFIGFFMTTKKRKRTILEAFIATATIVALFAVFADGFKWFRLHCFETEFAAMFLNRNFYGYYLSITTVLPLALFYKEKNKYKSAYYIVCFVINWCALLLTITRGAFLGAVFGIILLLIFAPIQERKFSWKIVIILGVVLGSYLLFEITGLTEFTNRALSISGDFFKFARSSKYSEEEVDSLGSGRIAIWKSVIEQIESSPIIGIGIGNFTFPHNEFLQVAEWGGIPALVFYLLALIATAVNAIRNRAKLTDTQLAALVGTGAYAASSFFGISLLTAAPFYICVLALCFNITIKINKEDDEDKIEQAKDDQSKIEPLKAENVDQ